jgi:hypothetical protein
MTMANRIRTAVGALAIVASLLAGGFTGCGTGSGGGAAKKADAVVVTYYYLPL